MACPFTDPTAGQASNAIAMGAAVTNFCISALVSAVRMGTVSTPDFAYNLDMVDLSNLLGEGDDIDLGVAANAFAVAVQSTTDLGDIPIPKGYKSALKSEHADFWLEAINRELTGLISRGTWELIPATNVPRGCNVMRCHYVFTVKRKSDGSIQKFKCRLVADGNSQKYMVDFDRVFSAVVKPTTLRLVLCLAAANDYNISQIDVVQAFLQAELDEPLYMRVPEGLPQFDERGRPLVA
jgi:hypothetical protein